MAFAARYSTLVIFSAVAVTSSYAAPLGASFTYQGHLENGSGPVTATCDFEFALYEDASGTMQVGTTQPVGGVAVTGGVFTVGPPDLDFGDGAFDGNARWLKVSVCCPATCAPVALTPLVELTPAPHAIRAWDGVGPPNALEVDTATGRVGIGTSSPAALLEVTGASPDVIVRGENMATSGVNYGGYFQSHSADGYGVYGLSDGAGVGVGVFGETTSNGVQAFGVRGAAPGGAFGGLGWGYNDIGVYGLSPATSGYGVFGVATATSGTNYGVWGQTLSSNGYGVYGLASGSGAFNYGVWGQAQSFQGTGVFGKGGTYGVSGQGGFYGVRGSSDDPDGYGIYSLGRMRALGDLFVDASVGVGTVSPAVKLHVVGGTDTTDTGGGYIVTGDTTGLNISIDNNEIMARNNNNVATLALNAEGGDITMIQTGNGRVGIGTNDPLAKLHVDGSDITPLRVDILGDGELVKFYKSGIQVGSIYVVGSTVTYSAFTGSHYGWAKENITRGTLVIMTGDNRVDPDDTSSEPIYGIAPSSTLNDSRCLGAYLSPGTPNQPTSKEKSHLIMAVGNGDMWVVDSGRNIAPGDYLISSEIAGHAMLDDESRFPVGYVVARAAEPVDWSQSTDTVDGRKHRRISVFFESFERGSAKVAVLEAEIASLRTRLAAMEAVVARLVVPVAPGDAVLAKKGNEHD